MKKIPSGTWVIVGLFLLIFLFCLALIIFSPQKLLPENQAILKDVKTSEEAPETHTITDEATDNLVPEFPDLPEYPGVQLIESKSYTEEGGIGFSADYQTSDSLTNVFDWYRQELPKDDWKIIYDPDIETESNSFLIMAEKRGSNEREDILLSINGAKLENGLSRIFITHHQGMGEYGPAEKYE